MLRVCASNADRYKKMTWTGIRFQLSNMEWVKQNAGNQTKSQPFVRFFGQESRDQPQNLQIKYPLLCLVAGEDYLLLPEV